MAYRELLTHVRKRAGIYAIYNTITRKAYIGQAQDIGGRWSTHLAILKAGNHHSPHLQNSWDKYGERIFDFRVLQFCHDVARLYALEIKWFQRFRGRLYNARTVGGKTPRGHRLSPVTIEKLRQHAKRWGNTPEQRKLRSERAKRQHAEGRIGYKQPKNMDRVCRTCGTVFRRYPLFPKGYHPGDRCLVCMAEHVANFGGRLDLDKFVVDQDLWDDAACELTALRPYP